MKPRKEKQNALSKVETTNVISAAVLNATTRKAIAELEAGKGKRFTRVDAFMADLNDVVLIDASDNKISASNVRE